MDFLGENRFIFQIKIFPRETTKNICGTFRTFFWEYHTSAFLILLSLFFSISKYLRFFEFQRCRSFSLYFPPKLQYLFRNNYYQSKNKELTQLTSRIMNVTSPGITMRIIYSQQENNICQSGWHFSSHCHQSAISQRIE